MNKREHTIRKIIATVRKAQSQHKIIDIDKLIIEVSVHAHVSNRTAKEYVNEAMIRLSSL